ncbi:MAG: Ig-like domain-containing protein, partial [Gemmatimonadota bacterium]
MTSKNAGRLAAALTLLVASAACERGVTDLEPADFPNAASVFEDGFGPGVDYAAFEFSRVDALDIDGDEVYRGTASLRFDVPDADDPSGGFVGGVFYSSPRNLSEYNALTFWAKASRTVDVEEIGFGLDNAGNARFQTALQGVRLTSSWQQFAIPIPGPGSLTQEGGLFYLSEANQAGAPYSIWFDEVAFADLESVGVPQAEMVTRTVGMAVGDVVQAEIDLVIPVGGELLDVQSTFEYFDWTSSDPAVATVSSNGLITKVDEGTAEITATLDGAPVPGSVTVEDGSGLEGVVFDDAFGAGIGFASFDPASSADPGAVDLDDTEAYQGSRSVRVTIPASDAYAGGVFRVEDPDLLRDLSSFNALTFWAKAATPATLNVVGFGNDNSGTSRFITDRNDVPITADWQRYVVPIPDPSKLTAEGGLFTFAEAPENGANTIWFDEIAFVDLEEVGTAEPVLAAGTFTLPVGDTLRAEYSLTFPVDGESVSVAADARYFDWTSSDLAVATVSESGLITMVGEGTAEITATLGTVPATGAIIVQTGEGGGSAQIDLPITFD